MSTLQTVSKLYLDHSNKELTKKYSPQNSQIVNNVKNCRKLSTWSKIVKIVKGEKSVESLFEGIFLFVKT